MEIEIGGLLHAVDHSDQFHLACSRLLGGGNRLQHPLAIGEEIAIGAIAAEEDEAAQVDGLLQHRLQRIVDVIDEKLRFLLFGGGSG